MDQKLTNLYQKTEKIPGWLSLSEAYFLSESCSITSNLKGEVVEIGSFQGKSSIILASYTNQVYAVDPHLGNLDNKKVNSTFDNYLNNLKSFKLENKVTVIRKTSQKASKLWRKPIKLLFIDGLHDYNNAKLDYDLWSKHLVNEGIIAMHDAFCGWEGAGEVALFNLTNSSLYKEVGVIGSIIYAVKGQPNTLQKLNIFRSTFLIKLAHLINKSSINNKLKFLIIHRFLKLLLINRFTLSKLTSI